MLAVDELPHRARVAQSQRPPASLLWLSVLLVVLLVEAARLIRQLRSRFIGREKASLLVLDFFLAISLVPFFFVIYAAVSFKNASWLDNLFFQSRLILVDASASLLERDIVHVQVYWV